MTENLLTNLPAVSTHKLPIRIAKETDLPFIVAIYNQAIPSHRSTANITPVSVEGRKAWFLEHEPLSHPIFVADINGKVAGWCSLSVYRPGRMALRFTSEISCYIDDSYQHRGVGNALMRHALDACPSLGIKNVVAVIIDSNVASRKLVEGLGFQEWGHLPRVLDFDGVEFGEFYFGWRVGD
jgi:L-amino acid N-acyltransferase YncA